MKKLILILVLIAGVHQLKAQQLAPAKRFDTLANSNKLNNYLKLGVQLKALQIGPDLAALVNRNNFESQLQANKALFDNMPVAVLSGNSKMPVAKLGGNYNMPVANLNNQAQNSNTVIVVKRPGTESPVLVR